MKHFFLFALLLPFTVAFSQQSEKPFVLGVIDEINSAELSEKRTVNIYLPAGYNKNDTTKYPVIYLLDGGADEDFIHIAGIIQFNNFEWINRVPASIVVGITNSDRKRDMTLSSTVPGEKTKFLSSGHSDKFMAFIEKELKPFIQNKYKGNSISTLIGQSLGGLFASEVLLKKPGLFNKYIIVSPSLWWDNGSLLKFPSEIFKTTFSQKIDIYIGVGKEGLTPSTPARVMEDDAKALSEKIKSSKNKNLNVHFDYLPKEDHATIMHQAVFNAFRLLYPAKK